MVVIRCSLMILSDPSYHILPISLNNGTSKSLSSAVLFKINYFFNFVCASLWVKCMAA